MDDGTPEPRRCEVCGDPIRKDNQTGICGNPKRLECRNARRQKKLDAAPEPGKKYCKICGYPLRDDNRLGICNRRDSPECIRARTRKGAPEPPKRSCEVCGKPIRRNNTVGICSRTNECDNARAAKLRREQGIPARQLGRKQCTHPDGCPNFSVALGLCSMHYRRSQRTGDAGGGSPTHRRIVISPGDTFGRWTALEQYTFENKFVLVRCECGTEKRISGGRLANGKSKDCGCGWRERRKLPRPPATPYIRAGTVFERLTALEDATYSSDHILCRCECGTEKKVSALSLKFGNTRSCGCLKRDRWTTHGFSNHPLFGTWRNMVSRCTNPKDHAYAGYGGRGITVCERWLDPWLFAEDIYREIGPKPEDRDENDRALYELDRTDNERGYEAGNVRWADRKTQAGNKRSVAKLTRERDALAAELEALKGSLASRKRKMPPPREVPLF